MKKWLLVMIPLILFGTEVIQENEKLKNDMLTKMKKQNKTIVKMAAEGISKHLPQKVDDYTTLLKADYKDTNLIYIYTLNIPKKSDEEIAKEGKIKMTSRIKKHSCISAKRFLKSDITLTYKYISAKSKKLLYSVNVKKADCKDIWKR